MNYDILLFYHFYILIESDCIHLPFPFSISLYLTNIKSLILIINDNYRSRCCTMAVGWLDLICLGLAPLLCSPVSVGQQRLFDERELGAEIIGLLIKPIYSWPNYNTDCSQNNRKQAKTVTLETGRLHTYSFIYFSWCRENLIEQCLLELGSVDKQ